MSEYIKIVLQMIWSGVLLYWVISAFRVKGVSSQESGLKQFVQYWLPLLIAFALLGPGKWFGSSWLREKFIEHTDGIGWIGLIFCICGAIVACWSRYLLGRNWSLSIQRKEGHELIRSGPYKYVRHPIYSGLLLLFIGHAIIVGDIRAIVAVGIVFLSFWLKLRKEETLLRNTFGVTYDEYVQRTKALIPFLL